MVKSSIWTARGVSVRGAAHERSGQKNQDAVRLKEPAGANDFLLLAVSDGHGSMRSFRSDRGSVMAAECSLRVLGQMVRRLGPDAPLSRVRHQAQYRWPQQLIEAWKSAVRADVALCPFTFLDFAAFPEAPPVIKPGVDLPPSAYLAYGATLVVAAITRNYIIYSQLGDGDILAVWADGSVARPLPKQHEYMANQTVSLCTEQAATQFQVRVDPRRAGVPDLIMLSTDGYANCFGTDEGFFRVGADLLAYLRADGIGYVGENLGEWLRESSRDGSGDDITVGLVARCRALA